jgi:hypothetical protein
LAGLNEADQAPEEPVPAQLASAVAREQRREADVSKPQFASVVGNALAIIALEQLERGRRADPVREAGVLEARPAHRVGSFRSVDVHTDVFREPIELEAELPALAGGAGHQPSPPAAEPDERSDGINLYFAPP